MARLPKDSPPIWRAVARAPLRLLADANAGCVFVERTNDQHPLSANVVRRFGGILRNAPPDRVLLVDFNDQLSGVEPVGQLLKGGSQRFGGVSALAFSVPLDSPLLSTKRGEQIDDGVWEVRLANPEDLPTEPARELRELEDILHLLDRFTGGFRETLPASTVHRQIEQREQLKRDVPLLTAEQWRQLSGNLGKNPSAALGKYKADGRLFAVPAGRRYLYPEFQFSEKDGRPKEALTAVLRMVPEAARGWPLLSWFNASNVLLAGRKPLEVIDVDPEGVAAAAGHFYGPDD